MNDKTESIPRPFRFAAEEIPTLEVTVWRLDADTAASQVNGEGSVGDSPEFSAKVIDFSSKGLKLALPFSAQFEEVIAIRLEFTDIKYSYMGQATVRHIRAENDRWIAGCAIEPNLRDVVIDHLVTISGKERRQHPRSPITGEGWVRRAGDVEGIPATILNISKGGFCATLSHPLSIGERVQFLTCNKKGDLETIAVQIRWQSKIKGGHKIGCSFCEAKAYRKLMYCLTNESALSVLIKKESTKWYVVAAAMLAMSVPPAVHLIMKAIKDHNNAQSAVVAPVDVPHTKPVASDPPETEPTSEKLPTTTLAKKPAKKPRNETNPRIETQPTETVDETEQTDQSNDDVAATDPVLNDPIEDESQSPEQTNANSDDTASIEPEPLGTDISNPKRPSGRRGWETHPSTSSTSRRTYDLPAVKDVRTDRGVPDVPFEPIAPAVD